MKENEAPEKIYLRHNHKGDIGAGWLIFPLTNNDIEYTRTDAFIEKACFYIKNMVLDITYSDVDGKDDYNIDEFIKNFRKYMKGE